MASTTAQSANPHDAIRELYKKGRKSLQSHRPEDGMLTADVRGQHCRELKVTEQRLAFARKLARTDQGYTPAELRALLARDKEKPLLGIRHVELLLRVPAERREEIVRRLLKERWGVVRLTQEIQSRQGRRRRSGSGPHVKPESVADAVFSVSAASRRWLRLFDAVAELSADREKGKSFRSNKRWRALHPPLQAAASALNKLVHALESES